MRANGERIKQAREIRGMTQEELASKIKASQPHISLLEQNADSPSESLLESIALATGFPAGFFLRASGPDFPLGSLLYRKTRKMSASGTAELRQTARLALELVGYLESRFKPIPITVPRINCDPSEAAQIVRSNLGVSPDGPVSGLIRRLEKAGVLVLFLPRVEVEGFDAFSAWSDEDVRRPVIFLSRDAPGDRLRRTVLHEFAHLVLHQDFLGSLKELEKEANIFAAEFLFPEAAMKEEVEPPLTLTRLADLKRRWGVSMQAVAYDACERGLISSRQKRYIMAKLFNRGWIEREPVQIPIELPRLLTQMIDSGFPSEAEAIRRLSKDMGFSQSFLEGIIQANRPQKTDIAPAGPSSEANILSFSPRRRSTTA